MSHPGESDVTTTVEPFLLDPGNRTFFNGEAPFRRILVGQMIKQVALVAGEIALIIFILWEIGGKISRIRLEQIGEDPTARQIW